jgi:DNA-binding CsgD family transcriptional regulator
MLKYEFIFSNPVSNTGYRGILMRQLILEKMSMQPYRRGVKLIPNINGISNIGNLFSQHFNSYLLDENGQTLKMNPAGAIAIGFDSEEDAIGKSILSVSDKSTGKELLYNCMLALNTEKMHVVEETQIKLDGEINTFLTFKMPCYSGSNSLIGVYGCSIMLGKHPLISSLNQLSSLLPGICFSNIANLYAPSINQFHLSKRQQECLLLIVKGKTAKQIAKALGLSHRTVEEYLNNIKSKMRVATKSEMIEKSIDLL